MIFFIALSRFIVKTCDTALYRALFSDNQMSSQPSSSELKWIRVVVVQQCWYVVGPSEGQLPPPPIFGRNRSKTFCYKKPSIRYFVPTRFLDFPPELYWDEQAGSSKMAGCMNWIEMDGKRASSKSHSMAFALYCQKWSLLMASGGQGLVVIHISAI